MPGRGAPVFAAAYRSTHTGFWPGADPAATFTPEDDAFLDDLERTGFRYFVEQCDARTGLVRDRAHADGAPSEGKASISAEGFALTAWVIAAQRGWVERATAVSQVRLMLRFLARQAPRRHGFFYHFMEMKTGERAWKCEVSSIDTGLLLEGAIVAREYFRDPEITRLVDLLYRDADWPWFLNGGDTMALAWYDEHGFSRYRWSDYSEQMTASLLAQGSTSHPLPASAWNAWSRSPVGTYGPYHYIQGPPLFIHQYTHAYFDLRGRRDAYADYFLNSILATFAQRQFCMDLRPEYPSWSERLWGISASDSVDGYKAWGGPPRTWRSNSLDGTVVPCAPAGSLPFAPYETMLVLQHEQTVFGDRIWGRYGFVDAFNPETGWIDADVVGVNVGVSMVQAENARSGFVWCLFMQAPEVKRALRKAGFLSRSRDLTWAESQMLRRLAGQAWTSLCQQPVTPETAGLRMTAIPAAQALGLVNGDDALARAQELLRSAPVPEGDAALAQYAAGLVVLRQTLPSLGAEASARLEAIPWARVRLTSHQLASASRLAAFFQIAQGAQKAPLWASLARIPQADGPVFVLQPGRTADQLLPGLWLDERAEISGASAAQLAYALAVAAPEGQCLDPLNTALELEQFPAEMVGRLKAAPPPAGWVEAAPAAERAALLLAVANLIVPDCVRQWFQQDPLVRAGRAALPEFAEEAFGKYNSIIWQRELAGPDAPEKPPRRAAAVWAGLPRSAWDWRTVAGLEFKDSGADVRPGDPPLAMRFAFTWDNAALHFHAEVTDRAAGYAPFKGEEAAELYVNPRNDGMVWSGPDDFQFRYEAKGVAWEWFHNRKARGVMRRTRSGYTIDSDIPWSLIGLTPRRGLEFGVSPAVLVEGPHEWDPSPKLNWCYRHRLDDRLGLGVLRLQ